jgi:hypothetical protein
MDNRTLRVTFNFTHSPLANSQGVPDLITIDQNQYLNIQIQKTIDSIQNSASIEIINMNSSLRTALLSNFTAFNRRLISSQTADPESAAAAMTNFVKVIIEAGYSVPQSTLAPYGYYTPQAHSTDSILFEGEITQVEPSSLMPNQGVHITAFTHQVDRTLFVSSAPPNPATFPQLVEWAAGEMGMVYSCDTKFDNDPAIENAFASIPAVGSLPAAIAYLHHGDIAAYIDDNLFIVRDIDRAIIDDKTLAVSTFIDMPLWTEWGCKFTTLLDPNLQLMHEVHLNSEVNPSLNSTDWIISTLDYSLSSRDLPFYVTANCHPPSEYATGEGVEPKAVPGGKSRSWKR